MPDQNLLAELLLGTKQNIAHTEAMTEEKIAENSVLYVKNKQVIKKLIDVFIVNTEDKKEAIFTAGLSGVGKTEFVDKLNEKGDRNIINPDDMRKLMPGYSGANSSLYQHASAIGVNKLLDELFSKSLSFVLDTNLSERGIAFANIHRALKKDYSITIYYIHRSVDKALRMAQKREEVEGRKVPLHIFIDKGIGSIQTFNEILQTFKDVKEVDFVLLDIEHETILTGEDVVNGFKTISLDNLKSLTAMKEDLGPITDTHESKTLQDALQSLSSEETTSSLKI